MHHVLSRVRVPREVRPRAGGHRLPPVLSKLPGWLVDDAESVRQEAAPYRDMLPTERGAHLAAACRGAARLIASRADRARVLEYRDALPESTRAALARLRRHHDPGSMA